MIVAPFYKKLVSSNNLEIDERIKNVDWLANISMMRSSFYKTNPSDYKFIMQTDMHTEIDDIDAHRTDHKDLNLMASIVRSNTDFVLSHCDKMVLVGADHLFTGDVARFFEEDFDLGFFINVRRDSINNTVVLVNKNEKNKHLIDDFFVRRERVYYKELKRNIKEWGGDQESLAVLLQKNEIISEYVNTKKRDFTFNGLKIKLYEYNEHFLRVVSNTNYNVFYENILILDFKSVKRKSFIKKTYENLMETL